MEQFINKNFGEIMPTSSLFEKIRNMDDSYMNAYFSKLEKIHFGTEEDLEKKKNEETDAITNNS